MLRTNFVVLEKLFPQFGKLLLCWTLFSHGRKTMFAISKNVFAKLFPQCCTTVIAMPKLIPKLQTCLNHVGTFSISCKCFVSLDEFRKFSIHSGPPCRANKKSDLKQVRNHGKFIFRTTSHHFWVTPGKANTCDLRDMESKAGRRTRFSGARPRQPRQ